MGGHRLADASAALGTFIVIRRVVVALTLVGIIGAPTAQAARTGVGCGAGRVAFVTSDYDEQLHVATLDGRSDEIVAYGTSATVGTYVNDPSFSPDGTKVAYGTSSTAYAVVRSELRIVELRSGRTRTVLSLPVAGIIYGVRWSPTSDRIAFALWTPNYVAQTIFLGLPIQTGVFLIDSDGTDLTPVAPIGRGTFEQHPEWSPDGTRLAFTSNRNGLAAIYWTDASAPSAATRVTPLTVEATSGSWAPDGRRIAFLGRALPASVPQATEYVTGYPRLWVADVSAGTARDLRVQSWQQAASWSPDGTLIAAATPDGLQVIRPDGRGLRRLTRAVDQAPRWMPDGRSVAFIRNDTKPGSYTSASHVWLVDRTGRRQRQLTRAGYALPTGLAMCGGQS